MRFHPLMIATLPLALAACATTGQSGWTGSGAQPFDQALADCQVQSSTIADGAAREAALVACMSQKGWRRR